MTVSYVEREQAGPETNTFYDKAEDRFEMLLYIFKVFGHTPELGTVFTDLIMAILKDGEIDWVHEGTDHPQGDPPQRLSVLRGPARDPEQAVGHLGGEDQRHWR